MRKNLILIGIILFLLSINIQAEYFYYTNFDSGLPSEFSSGNASLYSVGAYNGRGSNGSIFSGNFLRGSNNIARLVLTDLPNHTSISIDFLLAIIDSWDGASVTNGPDRFIVKVDGAEIFNATFKDTIFPDGVMFINNENLGFATSTSWTDNAYNMGLLTEVFDNIEHSSGTLTIEWTDGGLQGMADESWAIDNIGITANIPELSSIMLVSIAAFLGLCRYLKKS